MFASPEYHVSVEVVSDNRTLSIYHFQFVPSVKVAVIIKSLPFVIANPDALSKIIDAISGLDSDIVILTFPFGIVVVVVPATVVVVVPATVVVVVPTIVVVVVPTIVVVVVPAIVDVVDVSSIVVVGSTKARVVEAFGLIASSSSRVYNVNSSQLNKKINIEKSVANTTRLIFFLNIYASQKLPLVYNIPSYILLPFKRKSNKYFNIL